MSRMIAISLGLILGGCGILLKHAKPEELRVLDQEQRTQLKPLEEERIRISTSWQLATRQRRIAESVVDASEAREDVAEALAEWSRLNLEAARLQMDQAGEELHAYCRARFDALVRVHQSEVQAHDAALEVAKAMEREQRRRYEHSVAMQERARLGAVMDRPGVLREDRDKELARWTKAVDSAATKVDAAMVGRRQAEVRANDMRQAWAGSVVEFQGRFNQPCGADWEMPEPGVDLIRPEQPVENRADDPGPLVESTLPPVNDADSSGSVSGPVQSVTGITSGGPATIESEDIKSGPDQAERPQTSPVSAPTESTNQVQD